MRNIAIFASGAGSNALNLIESSRERSDIFVSCVIVDTATSPLPKLIREKYSYVPVHVVLPDPKIDKALRKKHFEEKIIKVLEAANVEWILLAGYMRLIGPSLLNKFQNKILNIHPSILPAYPGLNSYERAFNDNVPYSGITIHSVDSGVDTGPVIAQEKFPRLANDTLESFVNRGKEIEWRLYTRILNQLGNPMNKYLFTIYSQEHKEHQLYWLNTPVALTSAQTDEICQKIGDSIDQKVFVNDSFEWRNAFTTFPLTITHFKAGVTDNPAKSVHELLSRMSFLKGINFDLHSGLLSREAEFNPLIQEQFKIQNKDQIDKILNPDFSLEINKTQDVSTYSILKMNDSELEKLSLTNCWALSLEEMKIIQNYFNEQKRNPTDVEIEMLAQTWSEHCKHKIFNAEIEYEDEREKFKVNSLFKDYIKKPTFDLNKPWAVSLFDDNAGVVRFRDGADLCIKVETHNSPSALDPYGGALTGILGVNRDIMGTGLGAKPVANTDVFCVGLPGENDLPNTLLSPEKILKGIHHGVQDGGNKSGIPTVNGAIYFDESYSGKPLVYCGTVGILPQSIKGQSAITKGQRPGDFIVMVGGDVGIDGIHGATASSLVMDKSTTIGMVQIGDPFSQKRMMDFLLSARDELLYNSITDNGAGGLSSSVGEMAGATNGATLRLDTVPLKYSGLKPWQILVSESQERMTVSVAKENWDSFQALAQKYQVKVTHIGEFSGNGRFTCTFKNEQVCDLSLAFLHDGLPKMKLKANFKGEYKSWKKPTQKNIHIEDHKSLMTSLVSIPSLASKEKWIRQYDHEVQGATVVKPLEGLGTTAPNDAGVLWYGAYGLEGNDGFAVASGLCPHFSIDDTKLMAKMAIDESVRNLMCHGADPEKIALVDNFCWPDPTPSKRNPDAEFKLAQLVRTCVGIKEMTEVYSMPFVSGKDSMKNDYHGENVKISVLPTLLVTALGHVNDVTNIAKSQAQAGEYIYRLGNKDYHQYFGHYLHSLVNLPRQNVRDFDWKEIRQLYSRIHSAHSQALISGMHDVSEGGFLTAMFEFFMMNNLGINVNFTSGVDRTAFLYSELPGHFVVSVKKENRAAFESHFKTNEWELMGEANTSGKISVDAVALDINELSQAWRNL